MKIPLATFLLITLLTHGVLAQDAPPPVPPPPPPPPAAEPAPPPPPATVETASVAQPAPAAPEFHRIVLGAYGGLGMAMIFYSSDYTEISDIKPRLGGMGEFHFMLFFNRIVGLDVGIGVMGKGGQSNLDDADDADNNWKYKEARLEIPLGAAFNFGNFRLGVSLVPNYVLAAKNIYDLDGVEVEEKIESDDWDDMDTRRFNISSRLTLGGRIPFNRQIALILSGIVESDLLNNYTGDESSISDRNFNLMFVMGMEFGL